MLHSFNVIEKNEGEKDVKEIEDDVSFSAS